MKLNFSGIDNNQDFSALKNKIKDSFTTLTEKTGSGNDFLGWLDLPIKIDNTLIDDIKETAVKFQKLEVVVVIGIGGSYLGAKAVIEALKPQFSTQKPEIIFAGHTLSEDFYYELLEYLNNKNFGLIVISKSGTTTEAAIAFRILLNKLKTTTTKDILKERIIAITDAKKGALKTIADKEGYKTFVIADDIGGRFSVLSPVGLVPIAIAGFNISNLIKGAIDSRKTCFNNDLNNNAIQYVFYRNYLYSIGKKIELLVNFNPRLNYIAEWWKQLFGESEGKENKGIFPASVSFTTDLHSLGQYIQQGERHLFETVLMVENTNNNVCIPFDEENYDGLNYLIDKRIEFVNKKAMEGTMLAHLNGDVANCVISIEKLDEYNIGYLLYFFEFSCGLSAYLLGINPFDQPGVEDYKKNMFKLLGKNV